MKPGAGHERAYWPQGQTADRLQMRRRHRRDRPGEQAMFATLTCGCGRNRGSITEFTGKWIEAVAAKFGAPETITLRRTIPPVEVEQQPDNAGTTSRTKANV